MYQENYKNKASYCIGNLKKHILCPTLQSNVRPASDFIESDVGMSKGWQKEQFAWQVLQKSKLSKQTQKQRFEMVHVPSACTCRLWRSLGTRRGWCAGRGPPTRGTRCSRRCCGPPSPGAFQSVLQSAIVWVPSCGFALMCATFAITLGSSDS